MVNPELESVHMRILWRLNHFPKGTTPTSTSRVQLWPPGTLLLPLAHLLFLVATPPPPHPSLALLCDDRSAGGGGRWASSKTFLQCVRNWRLETIYIILTFYSFAYFPSDVLWVSPTFSALSHCIPFWWQRIEIKTGPGPWAKRAVFCLPPFCAESKTNAAKSVRRPFVRSSSDHTGLYPRQHNL